ncbi:MAG: metallophosphoesterase [Bacillaceae bacterium]|nr:metallophosphoesterase [Bacillaceae bacterium]
MKTVIIVSDSHGLKDELAMLKERHQGEADAFIHCGDSELDYQSELMEGFRRVRGNCDFDTNYPNEVDFLLDNMKFYVTHGHLYRVKSTLIPLSYRAEEVGADIVCFGHSHYATVEQVGNTLLINPGSMDHPRGRIEKTYAKLTWENRNQLRVEFLDLEGKEIPKLSKSIVFGQD